jgi:predicted nucleic acid-binding protein
MRWLIDSDILIEGERGNPAFAAWINSEGPAAEYATADIIRAEFLLGVYAVPQAEKRRRGEHFYRERIAHLASFAHDSEDFALAARIAGEARRDGKASPSLADGLLAALALRKGATVATQNIRDFRAMGIPAKNPLDNLSR